MNNPEQQFMPEQPEAKETLVQIGGATEASESHPDRNEDTAFFNQEKKTAGVLDGMGGSMAGEEASRAAGQIIAKELKKIPDDMDPDLCKKKIGDILESAHKAVLEIGNKEFFKYLDRETWKQETGNILWDDAEADAEIAKTDWKPKIYAEQKFKGKSQAEILKAQTDLKLTPTATTASVAKLIERPDGGTDMVYGHVGDSRIYILRKNRKIEQITEDQGGTNQAVADKIITKEDAEILEQLADAKDLEKLDKKRAEFLKKMFGPIRRAVTDGLGLPSMKPKIGTVRLEAGERVLFTSDGIHDNLTNSEIERLLRDGNPTETAQKIVAAAKKRTAEDTIRSKKDDKTAIILDAPEAAIEEISEVEAIDDPEEVVELGEEDVEAVPIEILEAEDKRKSAEEIKKIKKAIGA
jgi:protein phosphatase